MTDRAPAIRCACGHHQRHHGADRRGRPICWGSTVCGCPTYRPETR